jgi:hypothetical protein
MRWILALAATLAILGCSGGSSDIVSTPSAVPPTPPANPTGGAFAGIWTGTLVPSQSGSTVGVTAMILPSGQISVVGSNVTLVSGEIGATGSTSADEAFTGEGTIYTPQGTFNPNALTYMTFTGSFGGTTRISGTYSGGGSKGTLSLAPSTTSIYGDPPALATLVGNYSATTASTDQDEFLIMGTGGNFSGKDANGTFSGVLTAVDPTKNAFNATVSYIPTGASQPVAYTGVAYVETTVSPLTFYILASSPTAGMWAIEFQAST